MISMYVPLWKDVSLKNSLFRKKKKTKMEREHKSKIDPYIGRIKSCADEMEKTRCDYVRECSDYYDKYLNRYLMKEKRFWMMDEEMKVNLQIRDQEDAEEFVKRWKCSRFELEQQQKKNMKPVQSIRRRQKEMTYTMESLCSKASQP